MGAEVLELCIKDRKLQCIDDAADGVYDPASQKPAEGPVRQCADDLGHSQDAYPAHGDVDHRGEPFGTGDPQGTDEDAGDGDSPNKSHEGPSSLVTENHQADRCVGSGNQDVDHHMVNLPEHLVHSRGDVQGMVGGACRIEQHHADDKYGK